MNGGRGSKLMTTLTKVMSSNSKLFWGSVGEEQRHRIQSILAGSICRERQLSVHPVCGSPPAAGAALLRGFRCGGKHRWSVHRCSVGECWATVCKIVPATTCKHHLSKTTCTVLQVETPSRTLGPFCGHKPPPSPFLAHSHHVKIRFTTDGYGTNKGFTFHFQTRGKAASSVAQWN